MSLSFTPLLPPFFDNITQAMSFLAFDMLKFLDFGCRFGVFSFLSPNKQPDGFIFFIRNNRLDAGPEPLRLSPVLDADPNGSLV